MSSGEESEQPRERTRAVKTYPLNSKRLSTQVVHRIAAAMGLPKATLADTYQMVEGSLSRDREPRNVQVDLVESESGSIIRLRDADGVFLEIPPDNADDGDGSETASGDRTGNPEGGTEETERAADAIENGGGSPRTGGARDGTEASSSTQERMEMAEAALDAAQERITGLEMELKTAAQRNDDLMEEVKVLSEKVKREGVRNRELWQLHCEKLVEYDEQITSKEEEIEILGRRIAALETTAREHPHTVPGYGAPGESLVVADPPPTHGMERGHEPSRSTSVTACSPIAKELPRPTGHDILADVPDSSSIRETGGHVGTGKTRASHIPPDSGIKFEPTGRGTDSAAMLHGQGSWQAGVSRRGKAPPVDSFSGETTGITFDDWYPSLQRAADWNQWTDRDTLIQLAGHLRGRALQEWTLLRESEKGTLQDAVTSLRSRLDPGSRALVAQDFRHAAQREGETVADYISRLEQLFRRAYGREGMADETRDTLLHGQLQEGLHYELMKAPAVSGSHTYRELCLAARNEEKRVAELAKRRHYKKSTWEQPESLPPEHGHPDGSKAAHAPNLDFSQRPRPNYDRYSRTQGPEPRNGRCQMDQGAQLAQDHRSRPGPGRGHFVRGQPLGRKRCYECNEVGHMVKDCPLLKSNSE